MKVLADAGVRSHIREHGGMLFVWVKRPRPVRGALKLLLTSTEPPADALEWQRVEVKGFLVFLPADLRPPKELHLVVRGSFRRRVDALWEGTVFAT